MVQQHAPAPWAPPSDDELSWFLPGGRLAAVPRPLEYTGEVHAVVFGLTRAVESLDFPIYEVRSRLFQGRVYLAAVPSARAESDLARRLQRAHDASLRFIRDIRGAWQRGPQQEIVGYNERIEEVREDRSPAELAEGMRRLRRLRGNQWFTAIRAAIAPAAMLQKQANGALPGDAADVVEDALAILDRGGSLLHSVVVAIAARLVDAGCINAEDDIFWLEWDEVRSALRDAARLQGLVQDRRRSSPPTPTLPRKGGGGYLANRQPVSAPPTLGPPFPDDAPRMYLIREILTLLR